MANFYTDNKALQYHLRHPLMKEIVALRERDYTQSEKFDYAPLDFEDAMDSYERVLEVIGEICGDIIAPNAKDVDLEGPHHENGRVRYASGTEVNLKALNQAGLMGITLPRQYGGLNMSSIPYIMAADMVCGLCKRVGSAGLCRDHQRVCQRGPEGAFPAPHL